ncbi:MAG: CocE/NonD family hydrolase, partial [Acidimicrobiaceae bacterium]|nr:CocE/NonD family hydrolase [Acidimicrobiaceae bacterium]
MSVLAGALVDSPVAGVDYHTRGEAGVTDVGGTFRYRPGETITFSIGDTRLGSGRASAFMTPVDFFSPPGSPLDDRRVVNCARLLQSFGPVDDSVRAVVAAAGPIDFDVPEEAFADQAGVAAVVDKLGLTLRPVVVARNHLRRSIAGIRKLSDVKVPLRDDSYLLADVYRPVAEGRYPAIVRMSPYGRAFGNGSVSNEEDRLAAEEREHAWFEGDRAGLPPLVRYAENAVSASAADWVPRGYVLVRVDCRGVGLTPGELAPFSEQEALDYYDAIQWTASQPWCDGGVGLLGASYAATNQWTVAA